MKTNKQISDVSETSFLTIYCHAMESQSEEPILKDPKAEILVIELDKFISPPQTKLAKKLLKRKLDKKMIVHIAIRAKKYDQYAKDFLSHNPDGVIVNIGCGMDSRFERTDNGKANFYDLDLPSLISLKKEYFKETDRYKFIEKSVLDHTWMDELSAHKGPFMFLAEGVFMYLPQNEVETLFRQLAETFPGSELVCEVFNSKWLRKPWKKMMDFKMQKELNIGEDATFNFGIRNSKEPETWHKSIKFIEDWVYLDANEKKLGMMKMFRNVKLFRETQWTVHYKMQKSLKGGE